MANEANNYQFLNEQMLTASNPLLSSNDEQLPMSQQPFRVAVLLPCYNEEAAIAEVVQGFADSLPEARIHVFDNRSTDQTAVRARNAGARVWTVQHRGKGNVVRRMFADVDADIYVMADGDGTYDARHARELVNCLIERDLDMVVGARVESGHAAHEDRYGTYRRGHRIGNRMLTQAVTRIFGGEFKDMLSGYRVFSRRYAKSFPAISTGFEIETELTIHALEIRAPFAEIETPYGVRAEGSASKLSTYHDGWRILRKILWLYMQERPLVAYGSISAASALVSLVLAAPILAEFVVTGLVPRLPTAVLSATLMLVAFLMAVSALILDNVTTGRRESKRLVYLTIPGLGASKT